MKQVALSRFGKIELVTVRKSGEIGEGEKKFFIPLLPINSINN